MLRLFLMLLVVLLGMAPQTHAVMPLSEQIDQAIRDKAGKAPVAALTTDAEFVRRVYLDLAGRIPNRDEANRFFTAQNPDKRAKLIRQLLDGPDYPKRMGEMFHVMFMERLGDHADWAQYLQQSFRVNKPWNIMAQEILRAETTTLESKGASFFLSKRLENYGQQPVDYSALTRDIGRLFLGKDLRCAECHDHLFITDYKQQDFKGLYAFVQNAYLADEKSATVGEKPLQGKTPFASVFKKVPRETGPSLPGRPELAVKTFKKGEEYQVPPEPKLKKPGQLKYSPLALLAEQATSRETTDFARNMVNRVWFMLLGRGLVHPLDLHHSQNPPSHPELLTLLADEFVKHDYDLKWLIDVIANTACYQRSSVLPNGQPADPALFTVALEKRLSAEQLIASIPVALEVTLDSAAKTKILKAFANAPREPEDEITPMLKGALFLLNDPLVLTWFDAKTNKMLQQLVSQPDSDVATELYLRILSRPATVNERQMVAQFLAKHPAKRPEAIGRLAWAMMASTEFGINH